MAPSRLKARASPIQRVALVLSLLFCTTCGGGGGSSPTEPASPGPDAWGLQLYWEYYIDEDHDQYVTTEVPVTGTSYPIAGQTIVLLNQPGTPWELGSCTRDGVWMDCLFFEDENGRIVEVVYQPENVRYIAECRTTPEGAVQAFYHDALSHSGPGTLGPLVDSGCSRAADWGNYAECCLVEP